MVKIVYMINEYRNGFGAVVQSVIGTVRLKSDDSRF